MIKFLRFVLGLLIVAAVFIPFAVLIILYFEQ